MKYCIMLLSILVIGVQPLTAQSRWESFLAMDSVAVKKYLAPKQYNLQANSFLADIQKLATDKQVTDTALYRLLSNWNHYPVPKKKGIICEYTLRLDTHYTVPYLVYIPQNYNPALKTTLLIYYKGGWLSRNTIPSAYPKEIVKDNPTIDYLDDQNIIEIFPVLESKLAIYGNYGYLHLQQMITEVKKIFNIDDNKVFLSGFSDGGKTVYLAANLVPAAFACFYPINAPVVSAPQFPNYISRPLLSFVAEKDELTDPRSILTKAAYTSALGADWRYWLLPDRKHNYRSYQQEVLPIMFADIKRRYRNPFPASIRYHKTYDYELFTGIDWIQMNVNTTRPPSTYHQTDSVITFSSDGEERRYLYGEKTGQLHAMYLNNTFTINTSQVDTVTIYLSPVMVNLQLPVTVILNGKLVYHAVTGIDRAFMLDSFMQHFDREQLWVNKLVLSVPAL